MNADDDNAFLAEMADVTPLNREPRVSLRSGSGAHAKDRSLGERRQAAVNAAVDSNPLTDTELEPLDPWYVLEYKRPGIQNGVYRKLKQGRYESEARLDLHRMRVERARKEVYEFLREAHQFGLRSVLLIHGKGESKAQQEASAILKAHVNHWLQELEMVQAFHSAQPRHGGTGAVYVLLKKSEEKKLENRERFTKGRPN